VSQGNTYMLYFKNSERAAILKKQNII